ncbi:MAG: hypothetical protein BA870_07520 [Desulfuromonadales bacterium C00003094]|nr:MAG: hypothetical protein BA870_07520 [Desulfuromonadales bacterium C00003094]OEU73526.1 MAG: hypothetical protein BA869_02750 [Desulfuromonadales bacterium C00003107]
MFFLLLICLSAPALALDADAERSGDQPPPGTNPTDILTRGDLKYKFIKSQSGAETYALTARLDYALTPNVLVRVDVPYVDVDPQVSGIDSDSGLGDIFVRLGWRALKRPKFALFFGADFFLDTASEDMLGGGTTIAAPLVAGIWVLPEQKAVAGGIITHSFDVAGDLDISETEIRPLYVKSLPGNSWITIDSHFFIDWKDDKEFGWYQELQYGKMLTPKFGVTVTPGFGVTGDNRTVPDWTFEAGIRYFF